MTGSILPVNPVTGEPYGASVLINPDTNTPYDSNNPVPVTGIGGSGGAITAASGAFAAGSLADGADVTGGAKADAAVTDATSITATRMSFTKGMVKMWADIWDSVNHRIRVDGSGATQPVSGTVNTLHGTAIDSTNSSTTLLTASSVFTGTSQSALNYSALSVEVYADQASATNGLSIQQSTDGTNWDIKDNFSVVASTAFQTTINLIGQYYRVVYTNGATGQGTFRLQTVKQTSEVVLPRALTALGNLKVALQENSVTNPFYTSVATQLSANVSAYGSNAAATTATTDYAFKWGAAGTTQVNHVALQNNTTANINYAFDTAASAGSFLLAPGQTAVWDVQMTALHLYTVAIQSVNGTTSGNIVVQGWL